MAESTSLPDESSTVKSGFWGLAETKHDTIPFPSGLWWPLWWQDPPCCPQNQIHYPVCNKPTITHFERLWLFIFRVAWARVLGDIPQTKHTHWTFHTIIYRQKFRVCNFPITAPVLWWVSKSNYITPANIYVGSGEGPSPGQGSFWPLGMTFSILENSEIEYFAKLALYT